MPRPLGWLTALLAALMLAACGGPNDERDSTDARLADAATDAASVADAATDTPTSSDSVIDSASVTDSVTDSDSDSDSVTDSVTDSATATDSATPTDVASDSATATDAASDTAPLPWRSALYPEDWTPGFADEEGRYLADFSYAGYRNGETELAQAPPTTVLDVTAAPYEADSTGATDATTAVQAAIDAAASEPGGAVVFFPEGLYRFDGALRISSSRTVLRGAGPELSRLWFTASEGRSYQSHVLFRGALESDLDLALTNDVAAGAFDVYVEDAGELAPGDDVTLGQVITDEFVADHEMTDTWQAFNGQWHPFYWRTVVAVDSSTTPHRVTLDVPVRYPLLVRDDSRLRRQQGTLAEVGFESLGIADAVGWDQAWTQNQIHVVELNGVKDSWIRDVASFRSPGAPADGDGSEDHVQSGGLIVRNSKRVTVADVAIEEAQHRGGGGNGYLFEVRVSSEILFRDCAGRAGRHNFIQNWGFGATGIVWLRVHSSEARVFSSQGATISTIGFSEYHHSLATANLVDASHIDDGWGAVNRGDWSSGAGHSATRCVVWNPNGDGYVNSLQYGWGYVIGGSPDIHVSTALWLPNGEGTAPEDWTEGLGLGAYLDPPSLYEDQLARRLARGERLWPE